MSYGPCPTCGAEGVSRERRTDGYTTCANGHSCPSADYPPIDGFRFDRPADEIQGNTLQPLKLLPDYPSTVVGPGYRENGEHMALGDGHDPDIESPDALPTPTGAPPRLDRRKQRVLSDPDIPSDGADKDLDSDL